MLVFSAVIVLATNLTHNQSNETSSIEFINKLWLLGLARSYNPLVLLLWPTYVRFHNLLRLSIHGALNLVLTTDSGVLASSYMCNKTQFGDANINLGTALATPRGYNTYTSEFDFAYVV